MKNVENHSPTLSVEICPQEMIKRCLNAMQVSKDISEQEASLTDDLLQLEKLILQQQEDMSRLEKKAQQAEEGSKIKSEFLATMSHEIRTPLNGILGVVDMVLEDELSKESRDNLRIVQSSSQNLLTIINDILDFSKIEAGKLDIETYPVNLVHTIETCVNTFKFSAQDKGVEMIYDIDPALSGQLMTDGGRLAQIINNLVSNALKFTEEGHVLIRARLKGGMGKNRLIQISVSDTGIGISNQQQQKLFNAFTQADSSTSRKYGGTGLGLAISKKLSELLGGTIGLRSRVGKGTEFYFTIQCEIKPERDSVSQKYLLKDKRILFIDASKVLGPSLKNIGMRWGLDVVVTRSEETAIQHIEKRPDFGAIIIDYAMLDEFHVEAFIIRLKTLFPNNSYPLLLSTTLSNLGLVENKSLFTNIIPKPFQMESLKEVFCHIFDVDLADNQDKIEDIYNQRQQQEHDLIVTEMSEEEKALKILIVEDNKLNQKIAGRLFAKIGLTTSFAEHGLHALELLHDNHFDVIFMDMQMPELDGIETTEIIVGRTKFEERPLIIAMTANAMSGDREKCLAAGMDDYMSKPLRMNEIMRVIRKWSPTMIQRIH